VVALLAGGLFIYYRRRRLSNSAQSERGVTMAMDHSGHSHPKESMESAVDFIHPGAPWVRSVNNRDRSSVASSVATGWGIPSEAEGDQRTTLMLARATMFSNPDDACFKRDTSFDESNNATNTLAAMMAKQSLLLPAPAKLADDSMLENYKDPSFVDDNTPLLPSIASVGSFARLSFSSGSFPIPNVPPPKSAPPKGASKSVDIKRDSYRHSVSRSIGALSSMPMEAPKFPPPRMPPPRVPSTTSSIFPDDFDASKVRSSHGVDLAEYKFPRLPSSAHHVGGGTAGNRDSVASVSSVSSSGSIAQVNIARVEPLRARTTIIQQKPMVGSIQDMQTGRSSRMLAGDDARDRLSAVGSASFHRVAASMGGSPPNNHRKSLSTMNNTEQAYKKLVSQGIVDTDKTNRERRRSSMVREAMKRASVEFVVREGALVRKSDDL
jgi:hypothetical protein